MSDLAALTAADPARVYGVDVYAEDGKGGVIDWAAARAGGVTFAFAKALEGMTMKDRRFAANWQGMAAAGVIRGAYQFFRPLHSGKDQAAAFLDILGQLGPDDLPPVVDVEVAAIAIAELRAFIDTVADALGATPIVYTSRRVVHELLADSNALNDCALWVVDYQSQSAPRLPSAWTNWALWQFTDQGQVAGVGRGVDLNRFNGGLVELQAFIQTARKV